MTWEEHLKSLAEDVFCAEDVALYEYNYASTPHMEKLEIAKQKLANELDTHTAIFVADVVANHRTVLNHLQALIESDVIERGWSESSQALLHKCRVSLALLDNPWSGL